MIGTFMKRTSLFFSVFLLFATSVNAASTKIIVSGEMLAADMAAMYLGILPDGYNATAWHKNCCIQKDRFNIIQQEACIIFEEKNFLTRGQCERWDDVAFNDQLQD